MAFGPNLHVFPGGRVDPADADPARAARSAMSAEEAARSLGDNLPGAEALALRFAAVRELSEEAGVTVPPERLIPLAHWTTPRFMPRRFSTWFFATDLPSDAEPRFAPDEVVAHEWIRPAAALERLAAGAFEMWIPTSSVLEQLADIRPRTASDVAAAVAFGPIEAPVVEEEDERIVRLRFGAAGAVPGRSGVTTIHGRRELVVVDPGDASDDALDAIEAAAARRAGTIRAIVLTRTDPDHAAAAEALAIPLDVPILTAPGAGRRLPYETRPAADGERLPADVDLRVRLDPARSGRLEVVAGSERSAGK
jgi:8-oxo-dGTP pyrophosphatase MutT (NUDIX family)